MAATERVWGKLEGEFGLFSSEEASELFVSPGQRWDQTVVDQGLAIGVLREGELRFPGFQFDHETRRVRPVIRELISIATEYNYTMEDVTLLMVSPTTYFTGRLRPVDRLDDPDLTATIRRKLSVEW